MADKTKTPLAKVVDAPAADPAPPAMVEKLIPITDKQANQLQNTDLQMQALRLQYEAAVGAILAGDEVPEGAQFHGVTESKKPFGGKKYALRLMVPKSPAASSK